MAMIKMNSVAPILTAEEIAELELAEKLPVRYDDDSPQMNAKMLEQFTRMNTIKIKVSQADVKKIKLLGKEYKTILSRLLSLALADKEMLGKCI